MDGLRPPPPAPRRAGAPTLAILLVLVFTAASAIALTGLPARLSAGAGTSPPFVPPAVPAPPVRATTLVIPVLGIRTDLAGLGTDPAGHLVPPAVAGWFTGSAPPGEPGPTVISGPVVSRTGPGIFARLGDLRPGDVVEVGRSDSGTARFRVAAVIANDDDRVPTQDVERPAPGPELRLITTGSQVDRHRRGVVVTALLAG